MLATIFPLSNTSPSNSATHDALSAREEKPTRSAIDVALLVEGNERKRCSFPTLLPSHMPVRGKLARSSARPPTRPTTKRACIRKTSPPTGRRFRKFAHGSRALGFLRRPRRCSVQALASRSLAPAMSSTCDFSARGQSSRASHLLPRRSLGWPRRCCGKPRLGFYPGKGGKAWRSENQTGLFSPHCICT